MIHFLISLILTATALGAQTKLVLVDPPPITVDDHGVATVALTLENDGDHPIPLQLNLSDFMHKPASGNPYNLGASSTFAPLSNSDKADFNSGQVTKSLHLKLTVARLWDAGESSAILKNGEQDIPTQSGLKQSVLKAIRIPSAFGIQLDAEANTTPEIVFSRGGQTLVRVINNDAMNYRFRWLLRVDSQLRTSKSNPYIELPGHGSAYLDLTDAAPGISFLEGGTIKDELSPGEVVFQPLLDADIGLPPMPAKILPVNLRMQYWGSGAQQFWNAFWVFVLLTLGGMTSIWVHCGLPNTTSALAMTSKVAELETKLDGIGPDISSHSRVVLAEHLSMIRKSLRSTWWVFPSFAATLDASDKNLQMVTDWVNVAYDVSMVLRRLREKTLNGFPPTVLQWIQEKADCAISHFESGFTTEDELEHMHDDLEAAQGYLQAVTEAGPVPDLEKAIHEREARLRPLLPAIRKYFPLFEGLLAQTESQIDQPITPDNYVDRDTLSVKVDLLRQVAELLQRTDGMDAEPVSTTPVTDSPLWRVLDSIRTDAPGTLRMARLFVSEMRQGIYPPDLLLEVKSEPPRIAVMQDPRECDCGAPVHFRMGFHRLALNDSAAASEWSCVWDFDDGSMPETGWEVYHCFRKLGEHTVSVSMANLKGEPVLIEPHTTTVTVGPRGPRRPWYIRLLKMGQPHAETMLEASRLAMVLTLAVFGLVGSAQHQAQSLTLIQAAGAAFALGFGADTLKNLITQKGAN